MQCCQPNLSVPVERRDIQLIPLFEQIESKMREANCQSGFAQGTDVSCWGQINIIREVRQYFKVVLFKEQSYIGKMTTVHALPCESNQYHIDSGECHFSAVTSSLFGQPAFIVKLIIWLLWLLPVTKLYIYFNDTFIFNILNHLKYQLFKRTIPTI